MHQNLKELGDLTTVPVSRGDDERLSNSRRSRVLSHLSQFEFLKIRDFQKKITHPLHNTNWFLVSFGKSWRIEWNVVLAGIEELGRNSSILGSWDALRTWKASQMDGEVLFREEAARWQHFWIVIHVDWLIDWFDLNWFDLNWFDLNWFDLNWFDLNWFDLNWLDLNWFYFDWLIDWLIDWSLLV